MDTNSKNALILTVAALGGTLLGRWATPRLGAAVGLTFGPWGAVVGATIGGMLGAALATKMVGEVELPTLDQPDGVSALESD